MNKEIKAVAYYRMSSDKQEASIDDQRTAVAEYAASNGYKIIREYRDEGISGWKSEQRKGFQRLIADAEHGDFQAVLCWDQDRFSRFPLLEANHYWYLLDRAGVRLVTVAQGPLDFASLAGWLQASVTQHGKSEYVKDLARNTARGLRRRKLAGQWTGGVPLGYRMNGRRTLGARRPARCRVGASHIRFEIEGLWHSRHREGAQPRRHRYASSLLVACQERPCLAVANGLSGPQRHRSAFASEV